MDTGVCIQHPSFPVIDLDLRLKLRYVKLELKVLVDNSFLNFYTI